MEKEEIIALVGKENVSGWWNLGRIILIIFAVMVVGLMICLGLTFPPIKEFGPFMLHAGMLILGIFILIFLTTGVLWLFPQTVSKTKLKVEKINKDGTEAEVLGKDGKKHTVYVNKIRLRKGQKSSYLSVSGNVDYFWKVLIIGEDLNQTWKQ